MNDCIFCKIIKGEVPAQKVYEDNYVVAFLDITPINKGHTLVVPKHHCVNLLDMREEDVVACAKALQKVAKAVKAGVNAEGVNVGMNNEKAAGQYVFHAHFHVIPRFSHDGLKHWPGGKYSAGEADKIAEEIKRKF